MRYAIYAADQMYGGLHGMCIQEVVDVADKTTAELYALSCSYDVMDCYFDIMEDIEEEARNSIDENIEEGSPEWDELYFNAIEKLRDEKYRLCLLSYK